MFVDLHRHLDGSLRESTLRALAPNAPQDIYFRPAMGLDDALSRFAITLAVLRAPHVVRQVAAEMCEDAEAEGVSTLEIRFAPQLHGDDPAQFVDAAIEGVAGRAGIILCGLYGEPTATLEGLVDIAATRQEVVGIDLAGGPAPGHDFAMADYAPAFARARDLGIGRTVHAGEGRPPEEIRCAIEQFHAQRVGHGTTLLDDPAVLELVVERGITVEACPTSNVHTGVIADVAEHPIRAWLEAGVKVCVCADNTLFSQTDAAQELDRLALSDSERTAVIEYGRAAAFRR